MNPDPKSLRQSCDERGLELPVAVLDLDAFEHNRQILFEHFSQLPSLRMRIATKSLRCAPLVKRLFETDTDGSVLSGVMNYRIAEAEHLAENYQITDLFIAYPISSRAESHRLAALHKKLSKKGGNASIVVDSAEHVEILAAAGMEAETELPVVFEIDLAFKPLGEKGPHIGARRSPLSDAGEIRSLAELVGATDHVRAHGIMGYDAHHAATPDRPHEKIFKKISLPAIERLRGEVAEAIEKAGLTDLPLLNGGGSGSYQTVSASKWVNEVAVGSAFYKTALFDHHEQLKRFKPSLYYLLRVVRIPAPGWAAAFGGGYYASGGGAAPVIAVPEGIKPTGMEGFGEVQTPIRDPRGKLKIGDLVVCRPAKAGEPLERFNEIFPLINGKLGDPIPTYRGEGKNFG